MSNAINQIASAMAQQARHEIRLAREADRARPIGERAINVDFYDASDKRRSIEDTRWAACLVKWNGQYWQRIRRLTGPMTLSNALSAVSEQCRKRGLKRVD